MSNQNQEAKKSKRDKWCPRVQNLTKEPRDLGQGRGQAVKGRMVRGFPSSPIARRKLCHLWKKAKPRKVNIKALGP